MAHVTTWYTTGVGVEFSVQHSTTTWRCPKMGVAHGSPKSSIWCSDVPWNKAAFLGIPHMETLTSTFGQYFIKKCSSKKSGPDWKTRMDDDHLMSESGGFDEIQRWGMRQENMVHSRDVQGMSACWSLHPYLRQWSQLADNFGMGWNSCKNTSTGNGTYLNNPIQIRINLPWSIFHSISKIWRCSEETLKPTWCFWDLPF